MTNEHIDAPAYAVVVPPELSKAYGALPAQDHDRISQRLDRAARAAHAHPVVWPKGTPGIHRGRHRALIGELWVLYKLNASAQTLNVIGFGRVQND
jgi:hypothetical protein